MQPMVSMSEVCDVAPMNGSALFPRVLDSGDVQDELARQGLPSSKDSLSRCLSGLFWPGELSYLPRGGPGGGGRRMGNPGNSFTVEQMELVVAATELIRARTVLLGNLKTLRRFARQRGENDLEVFQALVRATRAQNGLADEPMERSA